MTQPVMDVVTIDGPAGSGKSSVSRRVAARLGYRVLDTGAMYRAAALKLLRLDIELTRTDQIRTVMEQTDIRLREEHVLLDGQDVSRAIRAPEMGKAASDASCLAPIRQRMVELQRAAGRGGRIVAEGRDMGTVVFPSARFKFYLNATPEVRARRRWSEEQQGDGGPDLDQTLAALQTRDRQDSSRELAPLRKAEDAREIDTTGLGLDEVVEWIVRTVQEARD